MLDIGWQELLVIGALALIVVGPKDLPGLLRSVGQWVGKIRRMAREFQRSMEDAAREADLSNFKELRDLKKDLHGLDFKKQASKAQSFLDKPVKPGPGKGSGETPAASAAASASTADGPEAAAPAGGGVQGVPQGASNGTSVNAAPPDAGDGAGTGAAPAVKEPGAPGGAEARPSDARREGAGAKAADG